MIITLPTLSRQRNFRPAQVAPAPRSGGVGTTAHGRPDAAHPDRPPAPEAPPLLEPPVSLAVPSPWSPPSGDDDPSSVDVLVGVFPEPDGRQALMVGLMSLEELEGSMTHYLDDRGESVFVFRRLGPIIGASLMAVVPWTFGMLAGLADVDARGLGVGSLAAFLLAQFTPLAVWLFTVRPKVVLYSDSVEMVGVFGSTVIPVGLVSVVRNGAGFARVILSTPDRDFAPLAFSGGAVARLGGARMERHFIEQLQRAQQATRTTHSDDVRWTVGWPSVLLPTTLLLSFAACVMVSIQ